MKREWLISKRKEYKITQQEVAIKSFIDRGYYSQIENGKRNPSPEVAYNIAKALNFDPMKFFKVDEFLEEEALQYSIANRFKSMMKSKVIYLYNDMDYYYNNLLTFVIKSLEKESHCIIIDHQENLELVNQKLLNVLPKSQVDRLVTFVDNELISRDKLEDSIDNFLSIVNRYDKHESISVWTPKNKHEHYLYQDNSLACKLKKLQDREILFVSYIDSFSVSAGEHIDMMRHFRYIMTDTEIVDSPLYNPNNRFVLPSLFIQENI